MYAKIFRSLYEGSLLGKLEHQSVFINMLTCSDKDGIVDRNPNLIACELGLPVERVLEVITDLESPDKNSRSCEEDGR